MSHFKFQELNNVVLLSVFGYSMHWNIYFFRLFVWLIKKEDDYVSPFTLTTLQASCNLTHNALWLDRWKYILTALTLTSYNGISFLSSKKVL